MKISTVFQKAAAIVLDREVVGDNAYYYAMAQVAKSYNAVEAAELFAEPYAFDKTCNPQNLSREERALLFGFLAEIAKQEGK